MEGTINDLPVAHLRDGVAEAERRVQPAGLTPVPLHLHQRHPLWPRRLLDRLGGQYGVG